MNYYNEKEITAYMKPFKDKITNAFEKEIKDPTQLEEILEDVVDGFLQLKNSVKFFKRRMHKDNWPAIIKAYKADNK
jgi:hypothetical protein